MKKSIVAVTLIFMATFNVMAEKDYSGHRISVGMTNTPSASWTMHPYVHGSDGNDYIFESVRTEAKTQSFNLTYGYDFNRFLGINAEFMNTQGSGNKNTLLSVDGAPVGTIATGLRVSQQTFTVEGEAGYTFTVSDWDIKPFVTAGLVVTNGSMDTSYNYSNGVVGGDNQTTRTDGAGMSTGFGVRAVSPWGVYAEVKTRKADVDFNSNNVRLNSDAMTTVNIGYKF